MADLLAKYRVTMVDQPPTLIGPTMADAYLALKAAGAECRQVADLLAKYWPTVMDRAHAHCPGAGGRVPGAEEGVESGCRLPSLPELLAQPWPVIVRKTA